MTDLERIKVPLKAGEFLRAGKEKGLRRGAV